MRVVAVLTALVAVLAYTSAGQTKDTQESKSKKSARAVSCTDAERGIVYYRSEVWEHQDLLQEKRSPTNHAEKKKSACAYKRWVARKWKHAASAYHKIVQKLDDEATAICYVFGQYCRQAKAVAWCESRWHRTAQNGQYLGLFQMGSSERSIYGHGSTPLEQARAAYRYFVASGRDWSPWSCRYAIYP